MLQVNVQPYASDALEDAMRLAQTKALNSYSFSDCLNYLNYAWQDMYQRIIMIDEGYYSKTVKLNEKLTKLPTYMKNSIKIYAAQSPSGHNRTIFRSSGLNDLNDWDTYHISGFDLYCPAATYKTVWINYVPMQAQVFFTHHNRDPKLYDDFTKIENANYNLYTLLVERDGFDAISKAELHHKNPLDTTVYDVFKQIDRTKEDWLLMYISCDFPYIFVTYKHKYTNERLSGFYRDIMTGVEFIEYNPFAYTGRNSNVEYMSCKWNDKTGMGVVIKDYNDDERIKELGWTPDTMLTYPCPEMYRLLVARLADKFSAMNESNVMAVGKEMAEATFAFNAFCHKDKSSWQRIDNVIGSHMGDML